jgi:hypothetical protein
MAKAVPRVEKTGKRIWRSSYLLIACRFRIAKRLFADGFISSQIAMREEVLILGADAIINS